MGNGETLPQPVAFGRLLLAGLFLLALAVPGCVAGEPGSDAGSNKPAGSDSGVLSGGGPSSEDVTTGSPLISADGNVVLHVTNGSIPAGAVDIEVAIDGRRVVSREVASSHTLRVFLELPQGEHVLTAKSATGEAALSRRFEVIDRHWIGLAYSYNTPEFGTPDPRHFNFDISDKEMLLL